MPIFSRRSLQRMIQENTSKIGREGSSRHVKQINDHKAYSIDTEWEIAVLYALGQVGSVEHERGGEVGRRIDVSFRDRDGTDTLFTADVVCVSDKSVEDQNPVQPLRELVTRVAKKAYLSPERFGLWLHSGPCPEGRHCK